MRETTDARPTTGGASRRLAGIDVARSFALFGMMAVHVLDAGPGAGGVLHQLAGGRSSALFAVLAGVGLVLAAGSPADLRPARRAIVVRAAAIGVIGMTLGLAETPAAVILVYYGVLFLAAVPVLAWSARRLALAAACWALLSPVASQAIRSTWSLGGPGSSPSWLDLASPLELVTHLLLTGYYPMLTWITYLLAGMAVGKLLLARPVTARTGLALAATGAGLAVTGWAAAWLCVRRAGGAEALAATLGPDSLLAGRGDALLEDSFYGTTPTTTSWFLGVMAPHSGAVPDLVHTTGTALLVTGLALALAPRAGRWVRPLAAAGSMTLTLYCLHVIGLGLVDVADPRDTLPAGRLLVVNIALAVYLATRWKSPERRGPLEELVSVLARLAQR